MKGVAIGIAIPTVLTLLVLPFLPLVAIVFGVPCVVVGAVIGAGAGVDD